jgi:hypothetical protein
MPNQKRKRILIAGIPGTGETTCGEFCHREYGYVHFDLEDQSLLKRLFPDPTNLIDEQARSINAHIVLLQRSVTAHLKRAESEGRNVVRVRDKCTNQVRRLLARVSPAVSRLEARRALACHEVAT